MELQIYQVDAFAQKLFAGNPAAVIPLNEWIADDLMQKIAMENNLSETVFFVRSKQKGVDYDIRWFTPGAEINLCGHATLASAFVIFTYLDKNATQIVFSSMSGKLTVDKRADVIVMDFPSWKPEPIDQYKKELSEALGTQVIGVYKHRDMMAELNSEEDVRTCKPDMNALKKIGEKVIITAAGTKEVDFVSRFFAPNLGIDEDPVTGSAHSQLIPFWAERLNKKKMFARQLSPRGGDLWCGLWGDRVTIAGQCVFYLKGTITV